MADVFVSYKREDRARAKEIAEALEKHGFSVFFDAEIDVGESFDERIEREIGEAKCVVVLWSPRSTAARWVKREARFGATHERLAPVIIGDCTIPLEFSDVQAANLQAWRGDPADEGWRQFIARVSECTQKPAIKLSPKPLRTRWARVVGGLLLAIALGVGGFFLYQRYAPSLTSAPAPAPTTAALAVTPALRAPSEESAQALFQEVSSYFPERGRPDAESCGWIADWIRTTAEHYPDWAYVADVRARAGRVCPAETLAAPATPSAPAATTSNAAAPAAPPAHPADTSFLDTLIASGGRELTPEGVAASAHRLGVAPAAMGAVANAETSNRAFGPDGRIFVHFEPAVFQRLTQRAYQTSHPNLTATNRDARTQDQQWALLREAYALDPESALRAAGWGAFSILGTNYARVGFSSAREMVSFLAHSTDNQLIVTERFLQANNLVEPMRTLDWTAFARRYNGPALVERYVPLLTRAYQSAAQRGVSTAIAP